MSSPVEMYLSHSLSVLGCVCWQAGEGLVLGSLGAKDMDLVVASHKDAFATSTPMAQAGDSYVFSC